MTIRVKKQDILDSKLPGATSIISKIFGEGEYKDIPPKILELACERGTKVHEYIENYILGNEPTVELEYQIYVDYFKDWVEEYEPIFDDELAEVCLISEDLGFKGIIDAVFIVNGIILCDWKTSSKLDMFKSKIQANLYYLLLKSYGITVDEIRVLSLTKAGFKYVNIPIDEELARAILYIYKEKTK